MYNLNQKIHLLHKMKYLNPKNIKTIWIINRSNLNYFIKYSFIKFLPFKLNYSPEIFDRDN